MYSWLLSRGVQAGWDALSAHDLGKLRLADDVRFRFEGDPGLTADLHSATELREWLTALFERYPRLRFEAETIVVSGPPWSLRVATRYRTTQDGDTVYEAAQFAKVRWGRLVEERVLISRDASG
jgi:ketosteroid isomerase-like protein